VSGGVPLAAVPSTTVPTVAQKATFRVRARVRVRA
jgi:hypothetical protein